MKRLQDLEQLKKLFVRKDGDINNIPMVSPSKTVQAVLDENGRSVVVQGVLGTYLALLFPNDATHTTLRFYQTIYGTSSKITGPVLNSASLITAYNASIAETYDTSSEDLTSSFANYLVTLSSLGFTEVSWLNPPIMHRQGPQRCITGVLRFTNATENNIVISNTTDIAVLTSKDLPTSKINWGVSDVCILTGSIIYQTINSEGRLNNDTNITCTPRTYFMSINFDYFI